MAERQRVIMDPAVAAVLGDNDRRAHRRSMTREQRKQSSRQRVTFEIDPRVAQAIELVGKAEECSPASVVNLLVVEAVRRYIAGEITFDGHRRTSRSPRWVWVVTLPENVDELMNELRERGQK